MKLEITVGGETAVYDIDVGLESMSMNDLIVLEKAVGRETIADLQDGHVSFEAQKGIIWLKLRDQIPGLKLDTSWDIPMSALSAAISDQAEDDDAEPELSAEDVEAELFAGAAPTMSPKV